MNLQEGWNLISLPMIQSQTDINEVFTSIDGKYDAVQYYDAGDVDDHWKHHHIDKSQLNDLSSVDHTNGIFLHITQPGGCDLTVYGSIIDTNQSITIRPGWNLIGYPSLSNRDRTSALNNMVFGMDVNAVWTYNASVRQWKEVEELDELELGRGYWIHSIQETDVIWDVPL
jgi:hypothetical protein